jgi:hypothetical protein
MAAIRVRIRANVFGSITIVATINAATANPTSRITEGRPSRYMTIENEKYTNVCCKKL